ncbi:MAG: hypothetical protein P8H88_04365, partial [Flavobacteriales bacterium]|nr:hypothetical protein [Flavobacteriales bacterium]
MSERRVWRPFRLSDSPAQRDLEVLASAKKSMDVRKAFQSNPHRVQELSFELEGLYVDMSKQRLDTETQKALLALAEEADVQGAIG